MVIDQQMLIMMAMVSLACLGLLSVLIANRQRELLQKQLSDSMARLAQQGEKVSVQQSQLHTLEMQKQHLELDKAHLESHLSNAMSLKQESLERVSVLEQKREKLADQKHQIDQEFRATDAKLQEVGQQKQEYKQRLLDMEVVLKDTRQQCADQQQRCSDLAQQLRGVEITAQRNAEQSEQYRVELASQTERLDTLQSRYESLHVEHKALQTTLAEREESHKTQLEQFEEQKQTLAKEFENLANKIFEQKGKAFTESSKNSLDDLLKPFREQIDGFQKRVNEVHSQSLQGHAKLSEQIRHVLDVGLKMQDEASNLTSALKGDKKAQGNWSEVQVELLLEMSGLHKGREYQREANFKTEEGDNQRPDFIVNLPNDKHIIIDSKISLNDYVTAMAADSDEDYQRYMKAHVEAIRRHVKSLSDKNYPRLKGINSPEYVFMFVGNEPAYLAAFNHDANLFQDAYRKGIAIVTPNTLLSSLRIVSHLWSIDKQNNNTRELADQASKVYDKLRVFVTKMDKLGNQIGTVQKTYQESWSTLKDGQGSLTKQVSKFVEMGVSVKEKLPSNVTEHQDMDLVDVSEEVDKQEENRQNSNQEPLQTHESSEEPV